jgi:hypothetical protein
MNAFVRHHLPAIDFAYSCFDRLLLNGWIRLLQWGGGIVSFLRDRRQAPRVTPQYLRQISGAFHRALEQQAQENGWAIVEPPPDIRREDWVAPYYRDLGVHAGVAVILRCRERARVAVCYPKQAYHIESAWRFVNLYYFYLQDAQLGRFFVRLCPYFPINAQVCLNGHEWLARQLQREGVAFRKADNAFVACADPERLQAVADSFRPEDISTHVEPWLRRFLPYFTDAEWADGYRHRLFVTQVEYCHNLIFRREAALDRLFSRLLDGGRVLGHPDKLAVFFGRQNFRPDTRTGQVQVKLTPSKTPVLRTGFANTSLKQYVKDRTLLRTETTCQQLSDLSLPKDIQNLPRLREILGASNERLLEAEQDVLASYVDRGQLAQLRQATVSATGRRTPGLRLDDARLLALLGTLTNFVYLIGKACFQTSDLLAGMQRALGQPDYRLSQLRYDLGKLRAKGLVRRLARSRRYELSPEGYRLAVLYQKLDTRLYGPLTAGILEPVPSDAWLPASRKAKLDRLYEAVDKALQALSEGVGIAA